MRVSAKSEYAVRAMVYLARSFGQGPVPLSQVAEREHIPLDFLEQVMLQLRNHGLVKSVRGVHGGYQLVAEPAQLSVGAVMAAVEGPPLPVHCVEGSAEDPSLCTMGVTMLDCTTRDVWVLLYDRIADTLNSVSLADLCQPPHRALTAELPMVAAGSR
jgi:Rrf2 family protein